MTVPFELNRQNAETPLSAVEQPVYLSPAEGGALHLNDGSWMLTAQFLRQGDDLWLRGMQGEQAFAEDYFTTNTPADIVSDGGALLPGNLVARLAGPDFAGQYAQTGAPDAGESIGQVDTISGSVTATRADGTQVTLNAGDNIFQGDVIETGPEGAIGVVFVDDSTFSMAEAGRMVMDEMVYDPVSETGSMSVGMVQGVFSFVSGKIAKTGEDAMQVVTPVATIGIRGTTVAGQAAQEGEENIITLLPDDNGNVGEIAVYNGGGIQLLNTPGATTTVTSSNQQPGQPFNLSPQQITNQFGKAISARPSQPQRNNRQDDDDDRSDGDDAQGEGEEAAEGEVGEGDEESAEGEGEEELSEEELALLEEAGEVLGDLAPAAGGNPASGLPPALELIPSEAPDIGNILSTNPLLDALADAAGATGVGGPAPVIPLGDDELVEDPIIEELGEGEGEDETSPFDALSIGDNVIVGTPDDDQIDQIVGVNFSLTDNDTIDGGAGNDTLNLQAGSNFQTVVVNEGGPNLNTTVASSFINAPLQLTQGSSADGTISMTNVEAVTVNGVTLFDGGATGAAIILVADDSVPNNLSIADGQSISGFNITNGAVGGGDFDIHTGVLLGGSQNDTLQGNRSDDILDGGFGDDTFIFDAQAGNAAVFGDQDTVTGDVGFDVLQINNATDVEAIVSTNLIGGALSGTVEITSFSSAAPISQITYTGLELIEFDGLDLAPVDAAGIFIQGGGNLSIADGQSIAGVTISGGAIGGQAIAQGVLIGGGTDDTLTGNIGADTLRGEAGADRFFGSGGNDTMDGGAGADTFTFERTGLNTFDPADNIVIDGGSEVDIVFLQNLQEFEAIFDGTAGSAVDVFMAELGGASAGSIQTTNVETFRVNLVDVFNIFSNHPTAFLQGGNANETLSIADGASVGGQVIASGGINGDFLHDTTLSGNGGNDIIIGNIGGDSLIGGAGDDTLTGDAGDDFLQGGNDNDTLNGGAGNDILQGNNGNDKFVFDATASFNVADSDSIDGGSGTDTLSIENVSEFEMVLTGGPGSFSLHTADLGSSSNQGFTSVDNVENLLVNGTALSASTGQAQIFMQAGNSGSILDVRSGEDIAGITNFGGFFFDNQITGTQLIGGDGADVIKGGDQNDTISGGAGSDNIHASQGADFIDGGTGGNTLVVDVDGLDFSSTISISNVAVMDLTAVNTVTANQFLNSFTTIVGSSAGSSDTLGFNGSGVFGNSISFIDLENINFNQNNDTSSSLLFLSEPVGLSGMTISGSSNGSDDTLIFNTGGDLRNVGLVNIENIEFGTGSQESSLQVDSSTALSGKTITADGNEINHSDAVAGTINLTGTSLSNVGSFNLDSSTSLKHAIRISDSSSVSDTQIRNFDADNTDTQNNDQIDIQTSVTHAGAAFAEQAAGGAFQLNGDLPTEILEITTALTDLSASTVVSSFTSLGTELAGQSFLIIAYDNAGDAAIFKARDGSNGGASDSNITSDELTALATLEGVGVGALDSNEVTVNDFV